VGLPRSRASGHELSDLRESTSEPRVQTEGRELVPVEPAEVVALFGLQREGGTVGGDDQIAQVQMLVGRLVAAGRDRVDVHVEGPRGRGVEGETVDARLLPRLPQRHGFGARLSGIGVAAGLKPPVELPMMKQQDSVGRSGHHEGASREMALGDTTVEGVGMACQEVQDARHVGGFGSVGRRVPSE
jgi:hypothetical protein